MIIEKILSIGRISDEEIEIRKKVYHNGYDEGYKQALKDLQPVINMTKRIRGRER